MSVNLRTEKNKDDGEREKDGRSDGQKREEEDPNVVLSVNVALLFALLNAGASWFRLIT